MSYSSEDTLFVQIAAYRDPELLPTLIDLFSKAKRPGNIFVGVCHQYDLRDGTDAHLFEKPFPYPEQIRFDNIDYRESQGCCWARSRVQKMYKNEKWTLMIDSHMRFEKNWDELLVDTYNAYADQGVQKPVLSCYVGNYQFDGERDQYIWPTSCFFGNDIPRMIRSKVREISKEDSAYGAFVSGHFIFSSAQIINDIPYDPHLYFLGEEISLAVRLWTHNYDIVIPKISIIYHFYLQVDSTPVSSYREKIDDESNSVRNSKSFARVKDMLSIRKTDDPWHLEAIDIYRPGKHRTLRDYERFSGINFRKKSVRDHTMKGIFETWEEVASIHQISALFGKIGEPKDCLDGTENGSTGNF